MRALGFNWLPSDISVQRKLRKHKIIQGSLHFVLIANTHAKVAFGGRAIYPIIACKNLLINTSIFASDRSSYTPFRR